MNLDRLEEKIRDQKRRFAGWFFELKSGMTYRLWEQGGYERQDGETGLYEGECGLSHDEALAMLEVCKAAREWHTADEADARATLAAELKLHTALLALDAPPPLLLR